MLFIIRHQSVIKSFIKPCVKLHSGVRKISFQFRSWCTTTPSRHLHTGFPTYISWNGKVPYGSFQLNSNRGVHPTSWIFFLFSILVDIIETKKFCEFEISTPFCFRVVAMWNIGGSALKASCEMKDPLKGDIFLKLNPLSQWKSLF